MADGGGGRCLSDLCDDLLRHILFLAPDVEGASTAVLSRRWRWLWRTSGAVFLDSRCGCSSPHQDREGFLRCAEKALAAAAAHGPIRRLTFFIDDVSERNAMMWSEDKLMEALVSNPAALCVEELIISAALFTVSFGSLPFETLRVLRLTRCSTLMAPPPGAVVFPMLAELHVHGCYMSLVDFQTIMDAAPRLSTLHLTTSALYVEKETIDDGEEEEEEEEEPIDDDDDDDDDEQLYNDDDKLFGRLLIPAVTALVVANFSFGYKAILELDVPRLQYFTFKGHVKQTNLLLLKSQASSNMIQVDLHLRTSEWHGYIEDPTLTCDSFRQFIQNFNTAKLLKLKLEFTMWGELLAGGLSFYLLDQLELEAEYKPRFERPLMVMLANLLHSCPMDRDIRIKLKQHESPRIASSIDKPNCLGVQLAKFFAEKSMVLQEIYIDDGCHEMLEHVNPTVRRWIAKTDKGSKELNVKD